MAKFQWNARRKAFEWFDREYPAIHAYLCPVDGLPLIAQWRIPEGENAVSAAKILEAMGDPGFNQYRVFQVEDAGQGCEYTPIRDHRQAGARGRHIHTTMEEGKEAEPRESAYGGSYYTTYRADYAEWRPIPFTDPASMINSLIDILESKFQMDDPMNHKKIWHAPTLRIAMPQHVDQIIGVLKGQKAWHMVPDQTGRGRPMFFLNFYERPSLEQLATDMPFLKWQNLGRLLGKSEWEEYQEDVGGEASGVISNPAVETALAISEHILKPGIARGQREAAKVIAKHGGKHGKKFAKVQRKMARGLEREEGSLPEAMAKTAIKWKNPRHYVEERIHVGPGGETHRELVRGVETEPVVRKNPGKVVVAGPHAAGPERPLEPGEHPSDVIVAELAGHVGQRLKERGIKPHVILSGTPRELRDMNRREGRGSAFRKRVEREASG